MDSDEEEGETKSNDRIRSQPHPGIKGMLCTPSSMSIRCVFDLSRLNAVYTISNK